MVQIKLFTKWKSSPFKLKIYNQRSKKTCVQANFHQGTFLKHLEQLKIISQLEPEMEKVAHRAGTLGTETLRNRGDPGKCSQCSAVPQTHNL